MQQSEQAEGGTAQQPALIDLPTGELLARFGAGAATPGSGSAAALMALLAASLVCAVAKMTVTRNTGASAQAQVMVDLLENRLAPRLKVLFEEDTRVFQLVIEARKRRDDQALANEKRKNTAEASDQLKIATNILFEIVELSFQILDNGVSIWAIGFQPAMGDAGAGISAALAAITTCLLVANVNLRSTRSSWSRDAKTKCDDIQKRMASAQDRVFQLVRQSVEQTAAKLALPFPTEIVEPALRPENAIRLSP